MHANVVWQIKNKTVPSQTVLKGRLPQDQEVYSICPADGELAEWLNRSIILWLFTL